MEEETLVRNLAARRDAAGLLLDIEAVERARIDVGRNLNIGLVMAVLFLELIRHAEKDRAAAGA